MSKKLFIRGTLLLTATGLLNRLIGFVLFAIPQSGIRGYLYGILGSELLLTVLHIRALSENIFYYRHSDENGL